MELFSVAHIGRVETFSSFGQFNLTVVNKLHLDRRAKEIWPRQGTLEKDEAMPWAPVALRRCKKLRETS